MTTPQELKKNIDERFDAKFKCECMLCAEKGYPFETTNKFMKDFHHANIVSVLEWLGKEMPDCSRNGKTELEILDDEDYPMTEQGIIMERRRIRYLIAQLQEVFNEKMG